MRGLGSPEQTGLLSGLMGLASAAAAITAARLTARITLWARWLALAGVLVLASLVAAIISAPWVLVTSMTMAGASVGVLLVTLNLVGARMSSGGNTSLIMVLLTSAITAGQALATAVAAPMAESTGYQGAAMTTVAIFSGALLTALVATVLQKVRETSK